MSLKRKVKNKKKHKLIVIRRCFKGTSFFDFIQPQSTQRDAKDSDQNFQDFRIIKMRVQYIEK